MQQPYPETRNPNITNSTTKTWQPKTQVRWNTIKLCHFWLLKNTTFRVEAERWWWRTKSHWVSDFWVDIWNLLLSLIPFNTRTLHGSYVLLLYARRKSSAIPSTVSSTYFLLFPRRRVLSDDFYRFRYDRFFHGCSRRILHRIPSWLLLRFVFGSSMMLTTVRFSITSKRRVLLRFSAVSSAISSTASSTAIPLWWDW